VTQTQWTTKYNTTKDRSSDQTRRQAWNLWRYRNLTASVQFSGGATKRNHGCQLIFAAHCQTYRNLLPNCYRKCQIIFPTQTDPNKLTMQRSALFWARYRAWIVKFLQLSYC